MVCSSFSSDHKHSLAYRGEAFTLTTGRDDSPCVGYTTFEDAEYEWAKWLLLLPSQVARFDAMSSQDPSGGTWETHRAAQVAAQIATRNTREVITPPPYASQTPATPGRSSAALNVPPAPSSPSNPGIQARFLTLPPIARSLNSARFPPTRPHIPIQVPIAQSPFVADFLEGATYALKIEDEEEKDVKVYVIVVKGKKPGVYFTQYVVSVSSSSSSYLCAHNAWLTVRRSSTLCSSQVRRHMGSPAKLKSMPLTASWGWQTG